MGNNDTKKTSQYFIKKNDETATKLTSRNSTFFENYAPSEYTESYRILCTPSAFAKSTLFYIQEIGKLKSLKSHTSKRESLDSYLYIIVKSGSGVFTYQGRTYTVTSGNHIFIDCKKPYSHKSSDRDPWELIWVHFNGVLMKNYFEYYSSKNTSAMLQPENSSEIIDILEKLMFFVKNKDTYAELAASNLLNTLITILLTQTINPLNKTSETTADKINQIKEYIDNNYQKKIHLDMMAEDFYLSKYHMSREFKKAYGVTIANYTIARRITNAKGLLRFSEKSIEDIARLCGITDNSYFNKVFRKFEDMTATEYRDKWKGRNTNN